MESVATQYSVEWAPPDDFIAEEIKTGGKTKDDETELMNELEAYSNSIKNNSNMEGTVPRNNIPPQQDEDDFDIVFPDVPGAHASTPMPNKSDGGFDIDFPDVPGMNSNPSASTPLPNNNVLPDVPTFAGFDDDDGMHIFTTNILELVLPSVPTNEPTASIDIDLPDVPDTLTRSNIHITSHDPNRLHIPKDHQKPAAQQSPTSEDSLFARFNKLKNN